jgi:hypothetical protein
VQPIFIVTPARSGSTLLRYLLDSHPDIVSPPELNLSALLQHTADVWTNVDAALGGPAPEPGSGLPLLSAEARRRACKVVDEIMLHVADAADASYFCDKSLTTVDQLATVSQCYPKAYYVFLYRFPLDMIASGIEASRWGYNAFGFVPYIGGSPGNFVAGLANYWIDKTSKMVEFERNCTVHRARLYYELLCDDPRGTLAQLCEFMGLEPDETMVERTFSAEHGRGPGDYKIDFTGSVRSDAMGHGSDLPRLLLPDQITRMDQLLAELDYPTIESARRGDLAALLGLKREPSAAVDGPADEAIRRLKKVLSAGLEATRSDEGPRRSLEILLKDARGTERRLFVDADQGTVREGPPANGDEEVGWPRLWTTAEVLLAVADESINLAQASHDGDVRVEPPEGEEFAAPQEARLVMLALRTLLVPANT